MRITGGDLKGIHIPGGFAKHVRPTTDMVREALFNKLSHTIGLENARVLDLFSGSGIVSLECLSRGAASVVSVDKDAKNIIYQRELKAEIALDKWEIHKGNVFVFLEKTDLLFDIVFADPPYDMDSQDLLIKLSKAKLQTDGIFILEHRPNKNFGEPALETRKYGSTAFSIFAP